MCTTVDETSQDSGAQGTRSPYLPVVYGRLASHQVIVFGWIVRVKNKIFYGYFSLT
jgi:hypothetical protein